MTLREFYDSIGGSYDEALRRLMNEQLTMKYLFKFMDTTDYDDMMTALGEERWEDAFRHSHTLKGVCLNLELGRLTDSASRLCDALRSGTPDPSVPALTAEVEAAHALVFDGLRSLRAAEQ